MDALVIKQKEAKYLTFRVVNQAGKAVDLTGTTILFGVKRKKTDVSYIFSKVDGDFDKSLVASGILVVFLTTTNTNQTAGNYIGEIRITFSGSPVPIDKSRDMPITILQAITD